jgi:hypothetical protein
MTFKKLTEATKTKYTEADFAWDEKAMIAEYKAAVLDYMNGASMDDALKTIKAMLKSGGETIVKGKGPVRESRTAKIAKLKLHEEFKLYETMWEHDCAEQVELSNASTTTSNTPYRKKPISHEYNMLYADYSPEFTKLDTHIQNVHGKLANSWQYDKMIRDDIFRTYWVDKNGAEYRLEVTTTNVRSGEIVEHWDFVLEETEPNAHIIDRGYLMDYHHLLDKLLQYGVITDKSKCI